MVKKSKKFTNKQIEELKKEANEARDENGNLPYGWVSKKARELEVKQPYISMILSGKRMSKKSSGKKSSTKPKETKTDTKELKDVINSFGKHPNPPIILHSNYEKYKMPSYLELENFIKDHPDKICKKVYKRIFESSRDSGIFKDLFYIVNLMNQ